MYSCLAHRFLVKRENGGARILVPRASVSFGHVVGETKGSGSSHYRMSVNHGHPVTHA